MKQTFCSHIKKASIGDILVIKGWLKNKKHMGGLAFLEIADSTGTLQAVVDKKKSPDLFKDILGTPVESAVMLSGMVKKGKQEHSKELTVDYFTVVSASKEMSPKIRDEFDVFSERRADHLLSNRHLYIRNPQVAAALKARSEIIGFLHNWFRSEGFTELDAPVLTELPLYEDRTAIPVVVHKQDLFLTQCVGFYLESAVMAFEKVYNLGPSFRAEEGKSKRHLIEYWHIKGELAWVDREDIMAVVEHLVTSLVRFARSEMSDLGEVIGNGVTPHDMTRPFPRISYPDAIEKLQKAGYKIKFGEGLSDEEEKFLGKDYTTPFWVVGNPTDFEPFPYCIDPNDPRLTMTADLLAPDGFGELCGVAEKITNIKELDERMRQKGKDPAKATKYDWVREMREVGFAPHGGFGMGLERVVRWIFMHDHVRDFTAYPRVFGRKMRP